MRAVRVRWLTAPVVSVIVRGSSKNVEIMGKRAINGKERRNGAIMRAEGAAVEDITIGYKTI
jgi:hypothetical protein